MRLIWVTYWLNWVNPRRLKGLKGDELLRNGPSCPCEIFVTFNVLR